MTESLSCFIGACRANIIKFLLQLFDDAVITFIRQEKCSNDTR